MHADHDAATCEYLFQERIHMLPIHADTVYTLCSPCMCILVEALGSDTFVLPMFADTCGYLAGRAGWLVYDRIIGFDYCMQCL